MKQTAKKKNLFRISAVLLLAAFWVMIPFILNDKTVSADELSDTRLQASLSGAPINGVTPAGFSEWRLDDSGRRRLEVQASSVNLPAGTVLTIVVNNAVVGQMSVGSFGAAFFRVDTGDGQNVPTVNFGNPIQINNGAETILAGTFGTVTPTPSPSGSPNGTPNASPTPTASPNGTPNGTPSPSPTASPNGTPNPSPSATPTGSPNPSPTASPSPGGSPSPSPSGGELFAGLSGGTLNGVLPTGFAQYELHSSRTELEIEVYQVNLPIGTALSVNINGATIGQIVLESGGRGRLRLRSDRGQSVPIVVAGSTITIQNQGATILSGTFSGATASPSPSGSPNPSPSATPNGTPNPSPNPSATPTESPSPSPSPNETPSPSPSPSLGRYFEVHPTGAQLDPPVSSGANAEFKVFLNAAETQATLTGEFHNLSSAQTGAKIESQIGDGTLIHDFGVIGGANGNFASVTINVTPMQVQQLRAGLWFVTLSSANNPNGELGGKFTQHSNAGDFDGDGSNDLAVFRPSSGTWYAQNSNGFTAVDFGTASDIPVSADYDGDGKTDRAVFRSVNGSGVWEINRSADGGVTSTQFGFATDKPIRGDFDGDGRNDLAVYRPETGVWYVQNSDNTGFQIVRWGVAEDIPLSTDMDGDGKSDFTVFRPSTGVWYWINSASGQIGIVHFGMSGDKPVKGDFDGDGRDDVAVYRPSTGVWFIWKSSDRGYDIRTFGLAEDIPVPGNYDGDNKTDIAVFRPSDGTWYIWRSSDNTYDFRQFGLTGDIPTVR